MVAARDPQFLGEQCRFVETWKYQAALQPIRGRDDVCAARGPFQTNVHSWTVQLHNADAAHVYRRTYGVA